MRVALYPRVSGHEQEDNYSIPEQIERMKMYCESRDWTVYKIYTDSGYSGSNMNRPGLQEIIKDAQNQKIDIVLVYKLDRLSRSQKDTLYLIEDVFDRHNVSFVSMTENFDTSTPHGKAVLGFLAVFAQLEREKIRERTMVGKDSRAKEGLWHGSGQIPTGYDYIDGKLVINEYEAMQVREAAQMFIDLVPVRAIAKLLNEKGYRRKGMDWEAKNVRYALTNPIVIGKLRHRDKVYDGQHEPILDEETYNQICKIDMERKAKWNPIHRSGHKTLLGGMLFCKRCGARYARQTNGGSQTYYCCYSRSKKVPRMIKDPNCMNDNFRAQELDDFVIGHIQQLAIDPTHFKKVQEKRPTNDAGAKIKAIQEEIEKINSQTSRLMDLYAVGTIDLDTINEKVAELTANKNALQKELDALVGAKDEKEKLTAEEAQNLAAIFDNDLPLDQKRAIVQSLIYYIELDGENVFIHWKF